MKKPTQQDIAKLLGISRATVSHVLSEKPGGPIRVSEETKQRIFATAKEMGYEPNATARSLRLQKNNIIGLTIPDIDNPAIWQIIRGVELEAQSCQCNILLIDTTNPKFEKDGIREALRGRVDGLVVVPTLINVLENDLKLLSSHHHPVVVLGHLRDQIPGVDTVKTDYGGGAILLMSHLLELGHRRIGFIFGSVKKKLGEERLLSYQMMLNEADLPVDETLIIRTGTTYKDGYLAAAELLNRTPRPTAILALNDVLAIGAMHAIYEKGVRIPGDISVAGFDGIDVSPYQNPSLTTLDTNTEEIGRTSIRLIMQRLSNTEIEPQNILVPPKVIIRKSTGPAPEEQEGG